MAMVGLVASVLVALGTTGLSYTGFGTARADSTLEIRWVGRLLLLAGLPLTLVAWLLARRLEGRRHWPLLVAWSLPLLFVAPVLSRDLYAYAEQGFLVLKGFDPYRTGMGTVGGPFAELVDVFWRGTTTVYPPGALWVQRLVVELTGVDAYWSVVAMRLPAIGGLVLLGLFVPRLARLVGVDPNAARWAVLLNPFAVLHVVGGGHNDALAAGLAVFAVWLACPGTPLGRRWGWLAAALVAGLAASVKQPLALVVVAAAALTTATDGPRAARLVELAGRTAVATLLAVGAFLAVTAGTGLGFGWLGGSGSPYSVKTSAPASLLADAASLTGLLSFQAALKVTGPLLLVVGVAVMVWWGRRTLLPREADVTASEAHVRGPLEFLAGAFLVLVLALPGFQPWYLLWGGAYAAAVGWFDRYRRTAVAVIAFCLVVGWQTEAAGVPPLVASLVAAVLAVVVARLIPPHRSTA